MFIVCFLVGGEGDGNGERFFDEGFSFFFSSFLVFDSMAGIVGGSLFCIGLIGFDKFLFFIYINC